MSDLVEFLRDRLDEDERIASVVSASKWAWPDARYAAADGFTAHVARFDPARVLREVEAKRAMLAELTRWPFDYREGCDDPIRLFMHLLASVYSDHPDYDEAWRLTNVP